MRHIVKLFGTSPQLTLHIFQTIFGYIKIYINVLYNTINCKCTVPQWMDVKFIS